MTEPENPAAEKKPKRRKFSAKLPFSPHPPFEDLYAERVPLLAAFAIAAAEGHRRLAAGETTFHAAEAGVYTGNSLLACAELARHHGLDVRFVGLDTFSGFPELSERDRQLAPENSIYLDEPVFSDTSIDAVYSLLRGEGHRNVELIRGEFSETLPELEDRQYLFVNVDCDLFAPHIECLDYFYPRMLPGGVLYFDDFHSKHYPMARTAISEFMRNKPERLFHMRYGKVKQNHTKAFLIKF